jgi:hypothetical protein
MAAHNCPCRAVLCSFSETIPVQAAGIKSGNEQSRVSMRLEKSEPLQNHSSLNQAGTRWPEPLGTMYQYKHRWKAGAPEIEVSATSLYIFEVAHFTGRAKLPAAVPQCHSAGHLLSIYTEVASGHSGQEESVQAHLRPRTGKLYALTEALLRRLVKACLERPTRKHGF